MSESLPPTFAAIDFETAHTERDSACALAVIRVEGGAVVAREVRLIQPPRRERWMFTDIHGIQLSDVASAPRFGELWPTFAPLLEGVAFVAAHNAGFDRGVLGASLERVGLEPPEAPFLCTVRLARRVFDIFPTKLPLVCEALRIPLQHHDPASDAEACAQIVIQAAAAGGRLEPTHAPLGAPRE
ncbi:MAG: 3'-5' exonuclease [Deltaproteobacteria bacterium]|nr:3'-5' exonuclease [Deltaproteobacteria bacterium]